MDIHGLSKCTIHDFISTWQGMKRTSVEVLNIMSLLSQHSVLVPLRHRSFVGSVFAPSGSITQKRKHQT